MSDDNDILRTGSGSFRLYADGLALMMRGAGWALLFVFALGIAYWILLGISALLPEQSKERPDPTPLSYLAAPEAVLPA